MVVSTRRDPTRYCTKCADVHRLYRPTPNGPGEHKPRQITFDISSSLGYSLQVCKEFQKAIYHGREVGLFVEDPRLLVIGGFDSDDRTVNTVEVTRSLVLFFPESFPAGSIQTTAFHISNLISLLVRSIIDSCPCGLCSLLYLSHAITVRRLV